MFSPAGALAPDFGRAETNISSKRINGGQRLQTGEGLWRETGQHFGVVPSGGVDFFELGDEGQGRIGEGEVFQGVMDMRGFMARWLAGNVVAVDDEGEVFLPMP